MMRLGSFAPLPVFSTVNLFGWDHSLTASYTTSPSNQREVRQWGINYLAPIYQWGGVVSAFFAKSDVDTGVVAQVFDVSGAGRFRGISYTHYLPPMDAYNHHVTLGIEDRLFENDVFFLAQPIGIDVRSRPVALSYQFSYSFDGGTSNGYATYARNLGGGDYNTSTQYALSRFGAQRRWDVVRFGGVLEHALPKGWQLTTRADAQIASEALISGEQFGAGGSQSVRGYDERSTAGDSGVVASAEIWTPMLDNNARFIGFIDVGHVSSKRVLPGVVGSESLYSVGVGLRWFYKQLFILESDLGRTLATAGANKSGDYAAHVSLFFRF